MKRTMETKINDLQKHRKLLYDSEVMLSIYSYFTMIVYYTRAREHARPMIALADVAMAALLHPNWMVSGDPRAEFPGLC